MNVTPGCARNDAPTKTGKYRKSSIREEGHVSEAEILLVYILAGKIMPQVVHNIRKGGVEFGKPPHQGALAHSKLSSNDLDPRLAGGKELSQSAFHTDVLEGDDDRSSQ